MIAQTLGQNPKLAQVLERLYNVHNAGRARPSVQSLVVALQEIIDRSGTIYLLVDSLDERDDRPCLLRELEVLGRSGLENLHVLVSSRQETDIEDVLSSLATARISLEESVVNTDVMIYVRDQSQHDPELGKWSNEVRQEIDETLVHSASRM